MLSDAGKFQLFTNLAHTFIKVYLVLENVCHMSSISRYAVDNPCFNQRTYIKRKKKSSYYISSSRSMPKEWKVLEIIEIYYR